MSSTGPHLSRLSLLKALWAPAAPVKGGTRLWEKKSGRKGYQTEITFKASQEARAGNSGWYGRQGRCLTTQQKQTCDQQGEDVSHNLLNGLSKLKANWERRRGSNLTCLESEFPSQKTLC